MPCVPHTLCLCHGTLAPLPSHGGKDVLQRVPDTLLCTVPTGTNTADYALCWATHALASAAYDVAPYVSLLACIAVEKEKELIAI